MFNFFQGIDLFDDFLRANGRRTLIFFYQPCIGRGSGKLILMLLDCRT